MKIAIFTDTFPPQINGVSHFVWKSAEALAKNGNEVCVFVSTSSKQKSKELSGYSGNPRLVFLPSLPFFAYPGERFTIPLGFGIKEIRKFKPDVIHLHTPFGVGWEAVLSGKIFNIPIVGTHHTFFDHYLKYVFLDFEKIKRFTWHCTMAFYNRADLILSPSKALLEGLKIGKLKSLAEVVPNFIDTEFFCPATNDSEKKKLKVKLGIKETLLVYMGRVGYEKSIDQVIRAMAVASKKDPHIKLMIVGDGPDKKNLEELAQKLGIGNKTIFYGFARGKELLEILQAGDIFITASKSENMPLSVMEAMAAGLPVIGVDSLGVPEIVKDGKNGFIVAPDMFEDMAQRIVELAEDDKLRNKFSIASRELAMEYSKEKIVGLLEGAYRKAIKNKKGLSK
ncbi:MAG: glycosyltransferase [Patescibacteria group bacterium]|nr:glycosyltransferase [Patescibacteria group bacterium]